MNMRTWFRNFGGLIVLSFCSWHVDTLQAAVVEPGDLVVIVAPTTDVVVGEQPVAALTRGQQVRVAGVQRSWLLVQYNLRGSVREGWINMRDVRVIAETQPAYSNATPQYYQNYYGGPDWYGGHRHHWDGGGHIDWHGGHYDVHSHSPDYSHHHHH